MEEKFNLEREGIKLTLGAKGYRWEIKIAGDDVHARISETDIVRLKKLDDRLRVDFPTKIEVEED